MPDNKTIETVLEKYFIAAQGMINGTYRPEIIPTLVEECSKELATLQTNHKEGK